MKNPNPPVSILSLWGVWFAITLQCVVVALAVYDAPAFLQLGLVALSLVLMGAGVWPILAHKSTDEWSDSWTGN
ncbi:TPA: hypothetical protein QDA96_001477 [Burkholderia vietnamiensis]|uniref:hypothetical protein n=1 Tax=Burkholderia cepacia complex TaxID=87882 RepID=UPI00075D8952|nr:MULTISPECIES: hypothetical protein [Burkholderia cepacia complex]KVS26780.1 hypothetical protein WK34_13450 [Burkholderia vietnamiensis]MBR8014082.1 hypothetical protein [Burkholderia vietnamiensis]HDR9040831.1 hypothetical protein [Burkholderia vietnamiensis]HDR9168713.1 hypothetical protein [Burkholderia vietnamiensis]HDR9195831.1 hypothetical protein [Burkholderia vietnamiensis]